MLGAHQEKFMRDLNTLLTYIHDEGYDVRGGELLRTKEQQELYVREGKSKTHNSMHLKKCAIDLFIFSDGQWIIDKDSLQNIGDFWESLDELNRWGGNWTSFKDLPHFERYV